MYKCAMHCEIIIKLLGRHYVAMLKNNHFPSRWLDVLDIMIKKGKEIKIKSLE